MVVLNRKVGRGDMEKMIPLPALSHCCSTNGQYGINGLVIKTLLWPDCDARIVFSASHGVREKARRGGCIASDNSVQILVKMEKDHRQSDMKTLGHP